MLRQDEKYNSIASDQNLEKRWMLTILSCTSDLFGGWFLGGSLVEELFTPFTDLKSSKFHALQWKIMDEHGSLCGIHCKCCLARS